MNGKFLERDGRRVRLSTLTLPAPARWPYREHRSLEAVWEAEQNVSVAVQKWAESVTFAGDCAMENADREDACNAQPGPDLKHFHGVSG